MKPCHHAGKDQSGFSILEVLFAMAIFSIGILAVHAMQIRSTTGTRDATDYTSGNALAQQQVETLLRTPYADLVDTGYDSINDNISASVPQESVQGPFTFQWHVDLDPAGTPANSATIRVDIWHVNHDNRPVSTIRYIKGRDVRI